MKPSVARTVHYVSYGTPGGEYGRECCAAVVTGVEDDHTVDLFVIYPNGTSHKPGVVFDDDDLPAERKGGSWHWPERVPEAHEPGARPPRY